MKDFILKKKLAELSDSTRKKVEHFFGSATNSAQAFVDKFNDMSNKTRLKVVKSVGAGIMSILILAGFTGCMDELGNISGSQTTTPPAGVTSVYDTTKRPEDLTTPPAETTGKPAETTTPPVVTTPPEETTTTPPVVTTPPDETTTTPPGETTPSEGTTTTPPVETTPEDLPADEDGYAYPDFFANLVRQTITDKRLFNELYDGVNYKNVVTNKTPEIVFVDRVEGNKQESGCLAIYARFETDKGESLYTRMSFEIDGLTYLRLGVNTRYGSYAEYVDAMQSALESRAVLKNADISKLYMEQGKVNDGLGENFAKFVGQDFVDASINCVRNYVDESTRSSLREISGFAYDNEGNSYSYVIRLQCTSKLSLPSKQIIEGVENGTIVRADFALFESISKPITSVYQEQENEQ